MTNEATTPSGQPLGISHKPSKSGAMFTKFKAENKPAFIGYLPYGFPNPDVSLDAFRTMVEHGVDAVEIGLPYSDPVMDGPVIQAAASIALNNGETIKRVFEAVETVANAGGVATSGLEMSQNSERLSWSFEEVDAKLKGIMEGIFHASYDASVAAGSEGNLMVGANCAGFLKVATAMMAQGITY